MPIRLELPKWNRGSRRTVLTVDGELTSSDSTNHEETRSGKLANVFIRKKKKKTRTVVRNLPSTNTSVGASETKFLTDLGKAGDGTLTRSTRGLVDLGKHSVGGLRDDGSGETSNQTGAQVNGSLGAVGEGVLVDGAVDRLRDLLEDDEFGHGVGDPKDGGEVSLTQTLRRLVWEMAALTA